MRLLLLISYRQECHLVLICSEWDPYDPMCSRVSNLMLFCLGFFSGQKVFAEFPPSLLSPFGLLQLHPDEGDR